MYKNNHKKREKYAMWLHQRVHNYRVLDILYSDFSMLSTLLKQQNIIIDPSFSHVFFKHYCIFFYQQHCKSSHWNNMLAYSSNMRALSGKLEDHIRDTFFTQYNPCLTDFIKMLEENHMSSATPLMHIFHNRTFASNFIEFVLFHIDIDILLNSFPL